MTSSINVLGAVTAQLVLFSDGPLSNLSGDPVVTFILNFHKQTACGLSILPPLYIQTQYHLPLGL